MTEIKGTNIARKIMETKNKGTNNVETKIL